MTSLHSYNQSQLIINKALKKYHKRTKIYLIAYPLTARFASCSSSTDVLSVLRQKLESLDQSWSSEELWTQWVKLLHPIVSVLYTLSKTLDAGVRLVFPPMSTIFTGACFLLSAAKDTVASQDTLIYILKRIEMCLRPLEIYSEFQTTEMTDTIIRIIIEVLAILGIGMVEINQGHLGHIRKYLRTLIGKSEIEVSLKTLDGLIQEVIMATAVNVKDIDTADDKLTIVDTVATSDKVTSDGKEATQEKANDELPESLDETYARVLRDIKKSDQDLARRILQCLAVAIRPLHVEELAEICAIDVENAEGIPKLKPDWRWDDQEQALLAIFSGLITIARTGSSRIVELSHFSVKEFLTSARLATSSGDISHYHVDLNHAHMILAQSCLAVLLQPGNRIEEDAVRKRSPLLGYAAEHWVTHTQFTGVSPCLQKAMECLFDPDKPHFTAWLKTHNIDAEPEEDTSLHTFTMKRSYELPIEPGSPLYYAALCGFQDLVQHVFGKFPQHLNSHGGWHVTPLVAALARGHIQIVDFLHQSGADVDVLGFDGLTPFISATWFGDLNMVQHLLHYRANVNAKTQHNWSALHYVSMRNPLWCHYPPQWFSDIAELLLQHGADVDARGGACTTPLHMAVSNRRVEVVRVLLEHGANVDAENDKGITSYQVAAARHGGYHEIMEVLLEYGAKQG